MLPKLYRQDIVSLRSEPRNACLHNDRLGIVLATAADLDDGSEDTLSQFRYANGDEEGNSDDTGKEQEGVDFAFGKYQLHRGNEHEDNDNSSSGKAHVFKRHSDQRKISWGKHTSKEVRRKYEKTRQLPDRTVYVEWYQDGTHDILDENLLDVRERWKFTSVLEGDIVINPLHPHQSGCVKEIDVQVDLCLVGSDRILHGVPFKKLKSGHEFETGQMVLMDDWIGTVEMIGEMIMVDFDNGCTIGISDTVLSANVHRVVEEAFMDIKTADSSELKKLKQSDAKIAEAPAERSGSTQRDSKTSNIMTENHSNNSNTNKEVLHLSAQKGDQHEKSLTEEEGEEDIEGEGEDDNSEWEDEVDDSQNNPSSTQDANQSNCVTCKRKLWRNFAFVRDAYDLFVGDYVVVSKSFVRNHEHAFVKGSGQQMQSHPPDTKGIPMPTETCPQGRKHNLPNYARNGLFLGFVCGFRVQYLRVNWMSCNMLSTNSGEEKAKPPVLLRDLSRIKKLSHFDQQFSIGHSVLFKSKQDMIDLFVKEYPGISAPENENAAIHIISKQTKIKVHWQDGTLESSIPSISVYPYMNIDEHEYWPYEHVVSLANLAPDQHAQSELVLNKQSRVGVVQTYNGRARTARVLWFEQGLEYYTPKAVEEEVSVYELKAHPQFSFLISDIVQRIVEPDWLDPLVLKDYPQLQCHVDSEGRPLCNHTEEDWKKSPFGFCINAKKPQLQWFGEIVSVDSHGNLEIAWIDGTNSTVRPQEVLVYKQDGGALEDDSSIEMDRAILMDGIVDEVDFDDDEYDDDDDDDDYDDDDDDYDEDDDDDDDVDDDDGDHDDQSETQSWETMDEETDSPDEVEEDEKEGNIKKELQIKTSDDLRNDTNSSMVNVLSTETAKEEATKADKTTAEASTAADFVDSTTKVESSATDQTWQRFQYVDSAKINHFFANSICETASKIKRIKSEIKILASSLPDGILVRVYESRMDLFQVLIVGPDNTPYEDALFMFDVSIPSNFPQSPPVVYFNSWTGGYGRLNPNLYDDGKVCLSLLGTWHARETSEVWNPAKSTILQVLVSIQALVLVAEPYYNEAGFDKFIGTDEGARNSITYNEKAFWLTLKSIHFSIRNPPELFKREFQEYYYEMGHLDRVIKRCDQLITNTERFFEEYRRNHPQDADSDANEEEGKEKKRPC